MPGTNIPGVLTAGTFYQDGKRVFWDVHNPDNTVVIEPNWSRTDCGGLRGPSRWKPECGSYRSDDGTQRVAVFYEDSERDLRVEASIAIDRLPDFDDVRDQSLGAKRDRADKVLRAMLDQFLSQDPNLRPGELKRIGEQDVDVAAIINQFQQSRQTNTWKQNA
jgi:hypothetical protein